MRSSLPLLFLLLMLCAAPARSTADDADLRTEKLSPVLQRHIDAAIERGVNWLRRTQAEAGYWMQGRGTWQDRLRDTSLAALALLDEGMAATAPPIRRARGYVLRTLEARRRKVRSPLMPLLDDASLTAAFLLETGSAPGDAVVRSLVHDAADEYGSQGLWQRKVGTAHLRDDRRLIGGYLPLTQLILVGLGHAHSRGIRVKPDGLRLAIAGLEESQRGGAWAVRPFFPWRSDTRRGGPNRGEELFASTAAGLDTYTRAQLILRDPTVTGPIPADHVVRAATSWLGSYLRRLRLEEPGERSTTWDGEPAYAFYCIGEAGLRLGTRLFDGTDWYITGAGTLVRSQAADGSWPLRPQRQRGIQRSIVWHPTGPYGTLHETVFALLFLKRKGAGEGPSTPGETEAR